mgnify:CR=1 FL=1
MMHRVLLALALVMMADAALALTAGETARRSARRHGYTAAETACFVPVFRTYANKNRYGRWVAGGRSRRADLYRHEALTRCGVQR